MERDGHPAFCPWPCTVFPSLSPEALFPFLPHLLQRSYRLTHPSWYSQYSWPLWLSITKSRALPTPLPLSHTLQPC